MNVILILSGSWLVGEKRQEVSVVSLPFLSLARRFTEKGERGGGGHSLSLAPLRRRERKALSSSVLL